MNLSGITMPAKAVLASGLALTWATMAASPSPAAGAEEKVKWEFEVSSGIEYDSNISVIQLDTSTANDDFAGLIDAGLSLTAPLGAKTKLRAGYDFSQSLHFDFTNFDIQSHRASAGIGHDFGPVTFDIDYNFAHATLGRKGFLDLNRITPALSGFLGRKVFVRLAYDYTDKNFLNRTARDATVNAVGVSLYYFLDGTRSYFTTTYRYKDENATAAEFDYRGHDLRLRYTRKFPFGADEARFRIGGRYEKRNYRSVTPSIGQIRDDDRLRFETSLEIPISRHLFAEVEYEFDDFSSNLPSADFRQHLVSGRLGIRF
ncbi:MAG: DUF560 domain-containing protein [Alphaproteobacteria bacterium]|nr:MAG: DUF560 domain-containing protein [Alphaproteobacteria bacterium]